MIFQTQNNNYMLNCQTRLTNTHPLSHWNHQFIRVIKFVHIHTSAKDTAKPRSSSISARALCTSVASASDQYPRPANGYEWRRTIHPNNHRSSNLFSAAKVIPHKAVISLNEISKSIIASASALVRNSNNHPRCAVSPVDSNRIADGASAAI